MQGSIVLSTQDKIEKKAIIFNLKESASCAIVSLGAVSLAVPFPSLVPHQ